MEKKVAALMIHPETAAMLSTMENGAAGLMIKALCAYNFNADSEYLKDKSLRLAFELLRNQIDRDRAAYADKCVKNQGNIKSRWEKYDRIRTNTTVYDRIRTNTNVYDRINDTVEKVAETGLIEQGKAVDTNVYGRIDGQADFFDKKESLTKEKIININPPYISPQVPKAAKVFEIPEKLKCEDFELAWNEWMKYRREKKNALTASTAAKQLKMLAGYGPVVAVEMINRSIECGWTGLFAPQLNLMPAKSKSVDVTKSKYVGWAK